MKTDGGVPPPEFLISRRRGGPRSCISNRRHLYGSPWSRGRTWGLAVLKDSEATQSSLLSFKKRPSPVPPAQGFRKGVASAWHLLLNPNGIPGAPHHPPPAQHGTPLRATQSRCPHRRRPPGGLHPVCPGHRPKQSLSQHLGDGRGTPAPPATVRPTGPVVPRDAYSRRFLPPGKVLEMGPNPAGRCCLPAEGPGRERPDSPQHVRLGDAQARREARDEPRLHGAAENRRAHRRSDETRAPTRRRPVRARPRPPAATGLVGTGNVGPPHTPHPALLLRMRSARAHSREDGERGRPAPTLSISPFLTNSTNAVLPSCVSLLTPSESPLLGAAPPSPTPWRDWLAPKSVSPAISGRDQ